MQSKPINTKTKKCNSSSGEAANQRILVGPKPTPEEVAKAKEQLKDPKAKRSKMACMAAWLKMNPNRAASESRGEERQQYLEEWLVFNMRTKSKRQINEKSSTTDKGEGISPP